MFVTTREDQIEFVEYSGWDSCCFEADVSNGTLTFQIKTYWIDEGGTRQDHADLFAKLLARRAVTFFEQQGAQIDTLEFNWMADKSNNDNLVAFLRGLGVSDISEHIDIDSEIVEQAVANAKTEDVQDAVFMTWSGSLAKGLGYIDFKEVEQEEY